MLKNTQKRGSAYKRIVFCVYLSLICMLVSCEGGKSALVGKWIPPNIGKSKDFPDTNLELFKDGTGIGDGLSINWKEENNRFIITSSLQGFAYNYTVSDSILILTNDNGKSVEYENSAWLKKKEESRLKRIEKNSSQFSDSRDGKIYKTIKIGKQIWMAQNLDHATANGSWCYDNSEVNCKKYGRLYDWKTAKTVCPSGWHLPSDAEWKNLVEYVTDSGFTKHYSDVAGKLLKTKSGWNENGNGMDEYGFSALPGGIRYNGGFYTAGYEGDWWSSAENDTSNEAYQLALYHISDGAMLLEVHELLFFSVRCLKD